MKQKKGCQYGEIVFIIESDKIYTATVEDIRLAPYHDQSIKTPYSYRLQTIISCEELNISHKEYDLDYMYETREEAEEILKQKQISKLCELFRNAAMITVVLNNAITKRYGIPYFNEAIRHELLKHQTTWQDFDALRNKILKEEHKSKKLTYRKK